MTVRLLWPLVVLLALVTEPAADEASLWQAIRDGRAVAIMRHARAPGTGDPPAFRLDDCATQRNLSDEGRSQARAIGARFRANGIASAAVYSSQWCRCLDTAEALDLGPVEPLPALNSFYQDRAREGERTAALRAFLTTRATSTPTVLVTHQVNISAISGIYPASGEIVVLTASSGGEIEVLGQISPPG